MRRRSVQIYENVSLAGGTINTGIMNVEEFDRIDIGVFNGNAPSGQVIGRILSESESEYSFVETTGIAALSQSWFTLGGRGAPCVAMLGNAAPEVPRRMKFSATAGAGVQIFVVVIGTKYED